MKTINTLKIMLIMSIITFGISCSSDDDSSSNVTPMDTVVTYLEEGYLVTSTITGETAVYYTGYYEELPTGDIDLVANATSFEFFRVRGVQGGFIYAADEPGSSSNEGIAKYAIDSATQQLIKIDKIELPENTGDIIFLSETQAVTNLFGSSKRIITFDPSTMLLTGDVDISEVSDFPGLDDDSFFQVIHNEVAGKIYAIRYLDVDASPQFYDGTSIFVEVFDAATLAWEKTIEHPNAEYALFRGEPNTVIDESGNTYIIAQGQYGLDFFLKGDFALLSRPHILKIGADSEFDTDYAFNPIETLNPAYAANFAQIFGSMIYAGNNKAYAIGTATTDDPALQVLLLGFANEEFGIDDPEYGQLVDLVFNTANTAVLEVDLVTKAVSQVNGIPLTAGFAQPTLYNYEGTIYAQIAASGDNGFYEINPSTGATEQVFNLTTGGFSFQLIDLSAND